MVQPALKHTFVLHENLLCSFPRDHVGTDKQAQGCTGEGLKPEGLSPRLRARVLTGHLLPREPAGTDKQAQGCAGEGLQPEGLAPRLRARMPAVTCEMLYFRRDIMLAQSKRGKHPCSLPKRLTCTLAKWEILHVTASMQARGKPFGL